MTKHILRSASLLILLLLVISVLQPTFGRQGNSRLSAVQRNRFHPLQSLDWVEQKVTAGDGATQDGLGWSVAIDCSTALVGAPNATVNGHSQQGAAYIFSYSNGSWAQVAKLTANDGASFDTFRHASSHS